MSGTRKKSDNKDGGLGLGAAVLLGAGAAVAGFLAGKFFESSQRPNSSGGPNWRFSCPPSGDPRPANSSNDWENKTDKKLGARKKYRESCPEKKNIPDEMKCAVCLDNPREVCLVPCNHVCLCEDCADQIEDKCPMCQQKITNKKAVYIN